MIHPFLAALLIVYIALLQFMLARANRNADRWRDFATKTHLKYLAELERQSK